MPIARWLRATWKIHSQHKAVCSLLPALLFAPRYIIRCLLQDEEEECPEIRLLDEVLGKEGDKALMYRALKPFIGFPYLTSDRLNLVQAKLDDSCPNIVYEAFKIIGTYALDDSFEEMEG